tara:strand:+ start:939 stop:1055 length:117 start_codon:yes stop_codon:yes gene_type:complete
MSVVERKKLQWRSKKANHGRKPNNGVRKGKQWKKRGQR